VNRGDVVVAVLPRDKPRPAIVLRADRFAEHHLITLVPMTTELQDAPLLRIDVVATDDNGLREPSQAMVDRITSIVTRYVGQVVGHLAEGDMQAIDRGVMVYLGFAG
jgi:mRNA interferase MazF